MKKVQEKGFALVLSLVLLLVMSLMGGSLIVIASGDHKNNNTSDQYQQAFYVAETGLMEGEKWVIDNYLGHWHKAGTAEDPYAGSIPTYDEMMTSKDASFTKPGADDPGAVEYDANVAEYETHVKNYKPMYLDLGDAGSQSLVRHTYGKGPAYNEYKILDGSKTKCMNSFKNIEAKKELWVASGLLPKRGLFWDIIGPLVKKTYLLEEADKALAYTSLEITDILKKEAEYLKRYSYEFFVINVGGSAYKGSGASVAQSSGGVAPQQGTAYKIYACGKFFDQDGNLQIIVPIETMAVMPY